MSNKSCLRVIPATKGIDYKIHLLFSLILRVVLVISGSYLDTISDVPYTDVDYKVFTDASRYVLDNASPYDRHTFRYTPLLAFFVTPNILLHHTFGKMLFCVFDLVAALLIRVIIKNNIHELKYKACKPKHSTKSNAIENKTKSLKGKLKHTTNNNEITEYDEIANKGMFLWLYNPVTIVISTRGNCDSISTSLVLLSIYFLNCRRKCFIAGVVHGISVHFRLYPVVYSLAMYFCASNLNVSYQPSKISCKSKKLSLVPSLFPNMDQLKLIAGCILSLGSFTVIFYYLYGNKFLYETYGYHLSRRDTRHNFSLYFYLQYLTASMEHTESVWTKLVIVLPQLVLILLLSFRYGSYRYSFNFAILTLTVVTVMFNTVMTSQYFIWVMGILPLCVWQMRITRRHAFVSFFIWIVAQAAWLLPAYLLEFQGNNTFLYIWIQGMLLFCVHIYILSKLIRHFRSFQMLND